MNSIPTTAPSSPTRLEKLTGGLDIRNLRGVEIAPLSRATVRKSEGDVIYVDRLPYEDLLKMHKGASYINEADILPIDVVLGDRSLATALSDAPKFDYVVASHVVEHVANLVAWLADVKAILKANGAFRLAVPDRRFTFDYLRKETKMSEVLNAYAQRANTPTAQCILDLSERAQGGLRGCLEGCDRRRRTRAVPYAGVRHDRG